MAGRIVRVVALSAVAWAGATALGAGVVAAQEDAPPVSVPVGEWEGAQVAMSAPAPPAEPAVEVPVADTGSVPESAPVVASLSPAAPAARAVSAAPAQLPATGGELSLAAVAALVLGAGMALRRVARHPG
jgi:hypothetical protein